MTMLDKMKADTVHLLSIWGETLVVKRATTITYDDGGRPTQEWTVKGTYLGDWQPVSGSTMRIEVGMAVKSTSQVIFPVTANIEAGDRVYRADDSYENVNYIKKYEDHITAFLTKTEKE